jgi:ergothioneine biosynthesis protein EgtB
MDSAWPFEAGMRANTSLAGLQVRFLAVRAQTDALCAPLSEEDAVVQSMPDASPAKWHLAHTSWFFETFVLAKLPDFKPFHPAFAELFNSYYEAVGPRHPRPQRGLLVRPKLSEVYAYRASVTERILRLFEQDASTAYQSLIELGVHHEQQHQELIVTDVKHLFGSNPLRPRYHEPPLDAAPRASSNAWHRYGEGIFRVGHRGDEFAFDNETPSHRVYVEGFEIAGRAVKNGEFVQFIRDEGYSRPELWLSDGWNFIRDNDIKAPLYWSLTESDSVTIYTLSGMRSLPLEDPVCHVSYYEADAYARWAKARLPTEAEWERVACDLPRSGNFLDNGYLAPKAAPESEQPSQLFGDVWEWTMSAYAPYPGFQAESGALGEYNGKFMSGQMVLRGGSCATPADHIRATYRNFFPPTARWQFTGIRLARSVS